DLAGARRRRRVDDRRRPDLGEPVLLGMDVEEPRDQRALERRARTLVDGKSGARDLGAPRVVDDAEDLADLPVRPAGPGLATGRRIGADFTLDRRLLREDLAPRPDGLVGLFAADRHLGVGGIGDAQQRIFDSGFDLDELRVQCRDPLAGRDRRRLEVGDLRTIGGRTALDRLTDPLRGDIAFGLERLALAEELPAAGIQLERPIDDPRILTLVDRTLTDDLWFVAEALQPDAHGTAPASPPASVALAMTNAGSRLASSQPARGPFGRSRNAR